MRMKKFAWTLLALLALCLPALAGAEETSLVISEAMSRNPAIWQLDYQDYIEFYNAGDAALELSDYTLCRGDNLEKSAVCPRARCSRANTRCCCAMAARSPSPCPRRAAA